MTSPPSPTDAIPQEYQDKIAILCRQHPTLNSDFLLRRLNELRVNNNWQGWLAAWELLKGEAIDYLKASGAPPTTDHAPPPGRDYSHLWERDKDGNIKGPDRNAFVETILAESPFISPTDTEELLHYTNGAYAPGASWVKDWIEARFREETTTASLRFVAECVGSITRRSYVTRASINPPGYYCLDNGLLQVLNGTVAHLPHTPTIYLTGRLPVAYDPAATCPRFLAVLEELVTDEKTRTLINQEFGYTFVPGNPFKRAFFWVGPKNSGKSTLLEILKGIAGIHNITAVSLHQFSENRFATAGLYGKLLNIHADLSSRIVKDVGMFKMLLGRDIITAEKKFLPAFEFVNSTKLFFSANEMPVVPADDAFFERWIPTEFHVTIPISKQVPNLADSIVAEESSGILNWMLAGTADLLTRGRFDEEGDSETTAKTWRRLSDSLVWFTEVAVIKDPKARTPKAAFYSAYTQFCADNGVESKSERGVSTELRQLFPGLHDEAIRIGGRAGPSVKVWFGLKLVQPDSEVDGGGGAPGFGATDSTPPVLNSSAAKSPSEGFGATGAMDTICSKVCFEKEAGMTYNRGKEGLELKGLISRGGVVPVAPISGGISHGFEERGAENGEPKRDMEQGAGNERDPNDALAKEPNAENRPGGAEARRGSVSIVRGSGSNGDVRDTVEVGGVGGRVESPGLVPAVLSKEEGVGAEVAVSPDPGVGVVVSAVHPAGAPPEPWQPPRDAPYEPPAGLSYAYAAAQEWVAGLRGMSFALEDLEEFLLGGGHPVGAVNGACGRICGNGAVRKRPDGRWIGAGGELMP